VKITASYSRKIGTNKYGSIGEMVAVDHAGRSSVKLLERPITPTKKAG
jgi:hypothetical protein